MTDDILDYQRKQPDKNFLVSILFGVAILFFSYWYFSGIQKWPLSNLSLLLGLISLAVVATIRFVRNRNQGIFQYCYFVGKIALFVAIYLNFNNHPNAYLAIYSAIIFFALGIILLYRNKTKS